MISNTIIIDGVEYETELHKDMNRFSKIKIPEGWRLLTLSEFINLWNNHKNKFDWEDKLPDEVVEQPIKENKKKYPYWNVWLYRVDGGSRSDLIGYHRYLSYVDYEVRGVRFCRDVKGKETKE